MSNVLGSYQDIKIQREHPVIMERVFISNATDKEISLARGDVIGITAEGLRVHFGHEMTEAFGVLAEPVTIPAKTGNTPGEAFANVYTHGDFIADLLTLADGADDDDKAAAIKSLRSNGCHAA